MSRADLVQHDTTERLGPDDTATLREAQYLAAALLEQQERANRQRGNPGTCSNCGESCLPRAVYCDEDCRADHERREQTISRQTARR